MYFVWWLTPSLDEWKIKSLIKKENVFYRGQTKSVNFDYTTLDAMTLEPSNAISVSKKNYERLAVKHMTLKLLLKSFVLFWKHF